MAGPLYLSTIAAVGEYVADYLQQQKLILFSDAVAADIAQYCALHRGGELQGGLLPGQSLVLNGVAWRVTAVGSVATENFRLLGHITLSFDGAAAAELPGMVHLAGAAPAAVRPGEAIAFYSGPVNSVLL